MEIKSIILSMLDWMHTYYGNGIFLALSVFGYIYLFAYSKEIKKKLIYPILLLLFLLVNPVLYKFVFAKTRYWRWLWLLPNTYVIAASLTHIVSRIQLRIEKILVLLGFFACVIFVGTIAFKTDAFTRTQNDYKLNQEILDIADIVTEADPHPKCIVDYPLTTRIRQYKEDIELFYGRDGSGFIVVPSDLQKEICSLMASDDPDYDRILSVAIEQACDYIIVIKKKDIENNLLDKYSFSLLAETENYKVYQHKTKE